MKIHVFPLSGRIVGIVVLKNFLAVDCELKPIDLGRGNQRASEYVSLNPNRKIPTREDDRIVLWESNAIPFYMASKRPESGVWPSDLEGQADEKGSMAVLGLGPTRPGFHRAWGAKLQPLRSGA